MDFSVGDLVFVHYNPITMNIADRIADDDGRYTELITAKIVEIGVAHGADYSLNITLEIDRANAHKTKAYHISEIGSALYWRVNASVIVLAKSALRRRARKVKPIVCRACGQPSVWLKGTSRKAFVCLPCRTL